MSSIRVEHTLHDLARDCERVAVKARKRMVTVVPKQIKQGNAAAQRFARAAAGPHGTNYYKRITAEMTGALSGEFGPTGDVAGNAVGAGWRNGGPNTDLAKAADIQGPKFAKAAGDILDGLFW